MIIVFLRGAFMKKLLIYLGMFSVINFSLYAENAGQKKINLSKYNRVLGQASQICSKIEVEKALDKLAEEITDELKNENPIFICVLNGAIVPMGQLMTRLDFPLQMDYIHASRYRGKMEGGQLEILAKPVSSLKNRKVVLVEDIIDTGITLKHIVDYCYKEGAEKVYTATLIDKSMNRSSKGLQKADFVGIEIPNEFIIGYGLDYEEYFRNLDGIYAMPPNELF